MTANVDGYLAANREIWDGWSEHQATSSFYDLNGFRQGANHLRPYELAEVGPVAGKDLLHLQCRFGTDTLSWARLGARVSGIDFSSKATTVARKLAVETGIPGRFIESDVYQLPAVLDADFDIVYTSRGVLCWLPDIPRWAKIVAQYLRSGGFLYLTDIHPVARMFADETGVTGAELRYGYFGAGVPLAFRAEVGASYATRSTVVKDRGTREVYSWTHGLGAVVSGLAAAGLRIDFLHEFPFCDWGLSFLRRHDDNEWRPGPEVPVEIPLFFSLKASKPLR